MPFDPSTPRFHDYIARLFGARGHVAGQSVLDDVMPVFDVNDDDPATVFLKGVRMGWWRTLSPAVAGNFSWAAIAAPAGQPTILVVEHVWVQAAGVMDLYYGVVSNVQVDDGGKRSGRDGRAVTYGAGTTGMRCFTANGSQAATPVNQLYQQFPSAPASFIELPGGPWVVTSNPIRPFYVVGGTVNTALTAVHFTGSERDADEQELR